jgi:CRISPR system Cascade subunit CasA
LASFNVLSDPWIPVDFHGGTREYGIWEALEKAHELRGISDPSPLFQYGMYRLLIAFLTDAIRPRSIDDLLDILDTGTLPMDRIRRYIEECERDGPCFDLFDKKRPFLQSAWDEKLDYNAARSVALLIHDLPSGNNSTHFDHRLQNTQSFCPQICAKALCAVNVFCTSGLQGPSGINGAPPWYVLVNGKNLLEKLIFNLWVPVLEIPLDDPPIAWRNSQPVQPGFSVEQTSYLYGLTWQSRRICLIPEEESGFCTYTGQQSCILVRKMFFQKGWKFEGHKLWRDPHAPRRETEDGVSTVKPRAGRAAWRDLGPLVLLYGKNFKNSRYYRPEALQQYKYIINEIFRDENLVEAEIYGLVTDQAKYISWIQDRLNLDKRLISDDTRAVLFQNELPVVEAAAFIIKKSLKEARASKSLTDQTETIFFGQIRPQFLSGFQQEVCLADTGTEGWRIPLIQNWRKQLKITARSVFEEALDKLGTTAGMLEYAAKARRNFYPRINKTLEMKGE